MKIALVNPPFVFPQRFAFTTSQCLGLRYISSVLKANGCQVVFVDALMQGFQKVQDYGDGFILGLRAQEIVDRIPVDCDVVGVSVPFSQLAPVAHEIVDTTKEQRPEATVIMGGVYPSTQPELAVTSRADFIVVGEGERAIERIAQGTPPANVPGVYSTRGVEYDGFAPSEPVTDLDCLPFPDYTLPDIERYFDLSPRLAKGRVASLITSRGCPYDCEFCSVHPVSGYRWRKRSPRNVIEEIQYLVRYHGIQELEFEDDNFTLDPDRAAEILEGIIRLNEDGAGLVWKAHNGIRIDTLDERLIKLAKRSNCQAITLALEHGDPGMLKLMNKRLDLDKAAKVVEWSVKHRIPLINIFVIVGYPGETSQRFDKCVSYLKRLRSLGGSMNVVTNIAQPYPGTRLLRLCLERGYVKDKNCGNFLIAKGVMSTSNTVLIQTPDFEFAEVVRRKAVLEEWSGTAGWKRILKRILPTRLVHLLNRLRGIKPPQAPSG